VLVAVVQELAVVVALLAQGALVVVVQVVPVEVMVHRELQTLAAVVVVVVLAQLQ
jgi:hypothetical protein